MRNWARLGRGRIATLALALLFVGCGDDDDPTGPSGGGGGSYNSIAGSYAGGMTGLSQGIRLDANLSLTITQSGGSLSGSYAMNGVLSDGVDQLAVQGTGTLSGAIAQGDNPSVNLTIRVGGCPNYSAGFSGAYDTANQRLTISGPVDILRTDCTVAIRYNTTLVLNN